MKKSGGILLVLFPAFVFSQVTFEGKITYLSRVVAADTLHMYYYFSPGKIRIETDYNNYKFAMADNPIIGLLDSNIYYMLYPSSRFAIKLIIDTPYILKIIAEESLKGEQNICGFRCYGRKESVKEPLERIGSDTSVSANITSWYANELYFPYDISSYLTQSSPIHNNRICLSSEIDLKTMTLIDNKMTLSDDKIYLKAVEVEKQTNHDSLFRIPGGYTIQPIKMSQLLKDSVQSTLTLEEIVQEEEKKPEPPPPPPPKKSQPSKSPAKKEKQKPVKG